MMTDVPCRKSFNLGYSRGYNKGAKWPDHRPPRPPDEHVANLMDAATDLRNRVDGYLATISEDDELQDELGMGLDAVDNAMVSIGAWLKHESTESETTDD